MFDLAVIGAGPAGYSAAFEAVRNNLSVVIFEKNDVGGTCLNRGCVPTKYLSHIARKYDEIPAAESEGIRCQALSLDYAETRKRMAEIVSSLRSGLEDRLSRNVTVVHGSAEIRSPGLVVCGEIPYRVKNILIATGTVPARNLFPGAVSSDELLQLETIPARLHIIGGGTVAVEFAGIYRMLGSQVTLSIRADRILRRWDREISSGIMHSLKRKGVQIRRNCDFSAFSPDPDETVLCAVGRIPLLPEADPALFETGESGGILAGESGQTRTKGIYAAGDVVEGSPRLAHMAMEQGKQAVRHMLGIGPEKSSAVVRCIFPGQEAASVGYTEEEAREKGIDYVAAKQTMFSNARTMISTDERGFVKILADRKSHAILGAHLLCERAGDMVDELLLAVNLGITAEEMLRSVRPHPSYCEAVTEALASLEDKLRAD